MSINDSVKGEIKINYTGDRTIEFLLTVKLDAFLKKPEAWDMFGTIARSEVPIDQCLEIMAKMIRELDN